MASLSVARSMPGRFTRLSAMPMKSSTWPATPDGARSLATRCQVGHNDVMAVLKISIVFASGARLGPGKAQLLESIRDTGSISAAARDMGMSYKRAWLLLDSINQAFEHPSVAAATGGQRGGGAVLTAFGRELLERYRRIEVQARAGAGDDLAALDHTAKPVIGSKV